MSARQSIWRALLYKPRPLPANGPAGSDPDVSRETPVGLDGAGRSALRCDDSCMKAGAMKVTINIDCTPQEARAYMGLPDVSALNEALTAEMQKRLTSNIAMLAPDELMKNWMAMGAGAQEQFRSLMAASAGAMGIKP